MPDGQTLTKQTYENPEVVEGYIQLNALNPKHVEVLKKFAQSINGRRVLDLGCGPGQYSHLFAELGFDVTGFDYSQEMIKRAKDFKKTDHPPSFLVGDMRQLSKYFKANTFDSIWAMASLLHIRREEIELVLAGIKRVTKNAAPVYISLKGGRGTLLVNENHLGDASVQREFTYWTKEDFVAKAREFGLELTDFFTREGRVVQGQTTSWLHFIFRLDK